MAPPSPLFVPSPFPIAPSFISARRLPSAVQIQPRHRPFSRSSSIRAVSQSSPPPASPPPSSTSASPSVAPSSVRDAGVVVLGGGIIGLFASLLLNARGVPVTVVEREPEADTQTLSFNPHRSYALGLYPRGLSALSLLPELSDHLLPLSTILKHLTLLRSDGNVTVAPIPDEFHINFFMRFRLLHTLRAYVYNHVASPITVLPGHIATDVTFNDDGSTSVQVTDSATGEKQTLATRLLIAADGRRSLAVDRLNVTTAEKSQNVQSKAGFKRVEARPASTGMCVKSLVINPKVLEPLLGTVDDRTFLSRTVILVGQNSSSKSNAKGTTNRPTKAINIAIFPTTPVDVAQLGGSVLGVITLPSDHTLWQVRTPEEGYQLFQDTLPQVDVHALISPAQMHGFVEQDPIVFPTVCRPSSLVATIGAAENQVGKGTERGAGAVIVIGDAAHSFPPDSGQGVTAGLEDAAVLARCIDSIGEGGSIQQLAEMYEQQRDDDTWALARIAEVAGPYQYRALSTFRFYMHLLNLGMRAKIAQIAPRVLHPAIGSQLITELPYRTILQRGERTTRRLVALGVVVPVLVGFAIWMAQHQGTV